MNQTLRCLSLLLHPAKNRARNVYEMLSRNNNLGDKSMYLNLGYWSQGAQDYDQACEALAHVLGQAAQLKKGDRLLDVGFGFGDQDMYWAKRFGCAHITGLNITPSQVHEARQRVKNAGLSDQIDLHEGSATAMPFKAGAFDAVTALETAFHYDTREDFFREAYRVLKSGGRLATADIIPRQNRPDTLKVRLGDYFGRSFWQIPSVNLYPADVYAENLEKAGFGNVQVKSIAEHVYPPFCRYAQSRLKDPKIVARMNPLVRRFFAESVHKEAGFEHLDYIIATAEK